MATGSFNWASIKAAARQVVHETLGVTAYYQDNTMSSPAPINARWHNKIRRMGDLDHEGYAVLDEAVDRIIFASADSAALNIQRGGTVYFPDYGLTFVLQEREPNDGPYDETWLATR